MSETSEKNEKKTQTSEKKPATKRDDKARREAELFKRRYFDFYDDIKISVKEDW